MNLVTSVNFQAKYLCKREILVGFVGKKVSESTRLLYYLELPVEPLLARVDGAAEVVRVERR